eukprot:gb/GECG01006498.1/.p1 GENE.gb/GECG01006498.1/~~gb/GECG01006498.1/.p1  ORF type:complete len:283 (+),score=35.10 gb/GECG01006498.1/:1-849(+)
MAEEFEHIVKVIFNRHSDPKWSLKEEGFEFCAADYHVPFFNVYHNVRCKDTKQFTSRLLELIPKLGFETYMVAVFPTTTPKGLGEELAKLELDGKPVFPVALNVPCMELLSKEHNRLKEGKELQEAQASGDITFENASTENIREISFVMYTSVGPYNEEQAKNFEENLPRVDSGIGGEAKPYLVHVLMRYKGQCAATGSYMVTEDGIGFIAFFALHANHRNKGFAKTLLRKLIYEAIHVGGAKRIIVCDDYMLGEEANVFHDEGFKTVCEAKFFLHPPSGWT